MKKIIITILLWLLYLGSHAQMRSEYLVFKDTATGRLYIRKIVPHYVPHALDTGNAKVDLVIDKSIIDSNNFKVSWKISNIKNYVLQISEDSLEWEDLDTLSDASFDSNIAYPDTAKHYYRLYGILQDNSKTDYSNVISAKKEEGGGVITLTMPNDMEIPGDSDHVFFHASASYTLGTVESYLWSQVSGFTTTINSTSTDSTTVYGFTPTTDTSNYYKYRLIVTTNDGLKDTGYVTVMLDSLILAPDQFWILDSAKFRFGPEGLATIPGYTNVLGEPSEEVVTATSPNGWTVSTVGADTTLWNPSPELSDKSAVSVGMQYTTPSDPYGYHRFDSAAIVSGFINFSSAYVPNTYNLEISGLDPDDLYQIHLIGSITFTDSTSQDVYGTRTFYRAESGQSASLNTQMRTSKSIVLDTVKPDNDGIIRLSVTGQDTGYSKGSIGILSALEILHISRDSSAGAAKTELFKNYYDTAIFINDGAIDRLCIVYRPYNYDPSQSYPILLYLDGQEDAVKEDQWDPQVLTGDGIGIVAEGQQGKLYGLRENGDTAGFVTIIPQTQLNEFSLDNTEINNILDNFKSLDLFNTNDSLFIAGFSSGGASAVNYLYAYPSKVTGAFIQSPASVPPSSSVLRDTSMKFIEYGTHVWITTRGDAFAQYTDTIKKYIYAADSSLIYEREWYAKDHSGFAYEYRPDVQDGKYPQNIYDFFFNPTQNWRKFSKFVFRGPSTIQLKDWTPVHLNGFVTPTSRILVGTDSATGFSVTTIATNLWSGVAGSAVPVDVIRNFNFWTTTYVQGTNVIYKTGGSYASNGNNIRIRGLVPGRSYTVFLGGHSDTSASPHVITQYGVNGTDFGVMDNTTANEETPPVELVGIASDSGTIGVSVYPDPNSTNAGVGQIGYLMVRETENYVDSSHKSPLVNAGSDATITLPLDSVTLTATYKNLNHFSSGGDMASATWSVVDEPEGASTVLRTPDSLTTIAAELTEAGDYYFEFSATDDSAYTSKDTVKIHVFDASAPVPVGDRILIDLAGSGAGATSTTSPQDDGRYWNTLDGALTSTTFPLVYDEFVDTAGNVVNMSVTQTSTWWSGQNNINIGGGYNGQVEDYPSSACIDSWIINSSASPGTLQIKLPAGTYSIKFWGSRATSGTLTTGIKLSTDETYTTFNASNNSNFDNAAVFTDVVSDGSTAITFNVSGSSSSNSFGYLGLIDIKRTE